MIQGVLRFIQAMVIIGDMSTNSSTISSNNSNIEVGHRQIFVVAEEEEEEGAETIIITMAAAEEDVDNINSIINNSEI